MNYKNIRKNKGFDKYLIAYKLGISYSDYFKIEKGTRALSGEKLDLFNEIISDSLNIIEQNELYKGSKEWLNNTNIYDAIKQFGYTTQEMAACLCISNSYICKVAAKQYYTDSIILGLYLFLSDENNRIYAKERKNKKKRDIKECELDICAPQNQKEKDDIILELKKQMKVLSIRCKAYEELLLKNSID